MPQPSHNPSASPPGPGRLEALRKPAINAFITFHVLAFTVWLWPPGGLLRDRLAGAVAPYIRATGLWQSWGMFSPNPLGADFRLEAGLTFADGSRRVWRFYRLSELPPLARYGLERQRKWVEHVRQDQHRAAWDDTALWVARRHHTPANPPVRVVLTRFWRDLPPPVQRLSTAAPERAYVFHTRPIRPEELP